MAFQQILSYPLWNHTESLEEDGCFLFGHGGDQRTQTEHHNTMLSRALDKFIHLLQKTDNKPQLNNDLVTCLTQHCKLVRGVTFHLFMPKMFSMCLSVRYTCCFNHRTNGTSLETYNVYIINFDKKQSLILLKKNCFRKIKQKNAILTLFDVVWQIAV